MARPPLPIGTWGNVTVTGTPGNYTARTRFRDFDGVTRQVKRTGKTMGAARANLTADLTERTAVSSDGITAESRLSEVAEVWIAECESRDLAPNTIRRYREILDDHVLPGVGNLRVREATVSRLDKFVKTITVNVGAPTAKLCSSCLSGMMKLAVRHDAARTNPMRDVAGVTVATKTPRALTLDEVRRLRHAIYVWQTTPKRGRPPTGDLLDIVDLFLATGVRIGELIALRWCDVDLDAGTINVCGTIVLSPEKPARPMRQPFRKGKKPLTLVLPKFALDMLLRRRVTMTPNPDDVVFPSAAGTLRRPENVRKQLDKVLADTGLDWVSPHTFRRTVATVLANEDSMTTAAAQLGHGSEQVTARHYVQKPDVVRDNTALLDRFAPD